MEQPFSALGLPTHPASSVSQKCTAPLVSLSSVAQDTVRLSVHHRAQQLRHVWTVIQLFSGTKYLRQTTSVV